MARIEKYITAQDGRDAGRVFQVTEMPAAQAEKFAFRLLLALANTGVDIGDVMASDGFAGIAAAGIGALGSLPYETLEPMLDEMFGCVKFVPSANAPARPLADGDIEEIKTRFMLRSEILKLHMGDFTSAAESK